MAETALALTRKAADLFGERGIDNARLEAELLLAHVLGIRRLDLYLQYDRPIGDEELERFRGVVRRRLRREPLQYIVGETQFRTLTVRVDRRALIPRPETEVLVGEVLAWAKAHPEATRALDVGSGSGVIAIALLAEGGFETVVATDRSADAVALTLENADRSGVRDRIDARHGELWAPLSAAERFDVVVSNPPYIAGTEREALAPEVREWEPAEALFAGNDGLAVVHAIVDGAWQWLTPGGLLALEVGLGQAGGVARRLADTGRYEDARIVRDLAGRERIVVANRA